MDDYAMPICWICKNFNFDEKGKICLAFNPSTRIKSIPDSIYFLGNNNHTEPLPGQGNQVVFQEKS